MGADQFDYVPDPLRDIGKAANAVIGRLRFAHRAANDIGGLHELAADLTDR